MQLVCTTNYQNIKLWRSLKFVPFKDALIELSYHEGQKKQIKPSLMKFCIQKQAEQSDIAVMRRTAEVYGIFNHS